MAMYMALTEILLHFSEGVASMYCLWNIVDASASYTVAKELHSKHNFPSLSKPIFKDFLKYNFKNLHSVMHATLTKNDEEYEELKLKNPLYHFLPKPTTEYFPFE